MNLEEIEFQKGLPLTIKIFSLKKYPIQWHEGVTEIILPLRGSIEIETDFEKNRIEEGDFWFVNNKSVHCIYAKENAIIASFYIDLKYCRDRFKYIEYMFFRSNPYTHDQKSKVNDIDKEYKIRFRNMLVSILSEYQKVDILPESVREKLFNKLVYAMVYEFNWLQFIERKESFISPDHLDRYHRIMKYVDEHYLEKITLDDIISKEYITKTYFSHFWKKISSFSFQERINYERVLKSSKMLVSHMTITEISDKCGFSDPKYYYKHFKRWYGCMPLEYRSKCENYAEGGYEFTEVDLGDATSIVGDYLKKYFEIYYDKDVDSEATSIINHYANIKYLHSIGKAGDPTIPKYTNINILGGYCFTFNDLGFKFNWHNMNVLINLAFDIDSIPNIIIKNEEIDQDMFLEAVRLFADRSINYYGIHEVKKWNFSINYSNLIKFDNINIINDELSSRISNLKIQYYFEY